MISQSHSSSQGDAKKWWCPLLPIWWKELQEKSALTLSNAFEQVKWSHAWLWVDLSNWFGSNLQEGCKSRDDSRGEEKNKTVLEGTQGHINSLLWQCPLSVRLQW
jgi:hypothetical protein